MTFAPVPALVVSSTTTPALQGVMGVLRSLGPLGVPVHLVHPAGRTPMSRSRYATAWHRAALDPADPGHYVETLLGLADSVGDAPVLIGTDDLVAQVISEHADVLSTRFRLRVPDPDLVRRLSDKCLLAALCDRHGVRTPRSTAAQSVDQVRRFAAAVGLPVVVKAQTPADLRQGGASVRIAHTLQELEDLVSVGGRVRQGTLLQEHIPGGPQSVWMFNGYVDSEGRCRHAFTGQKVRQFRPDTGYTSYGVCTPNEKVQQIAIELLAAIGYRGVVDLGMRLDERTGEYLMLDVNPRLGATFRLFVGPDGTDVVRALYADLTGAPVPASGTVAGRTWATEPHDACASLLYARQGRLGLRAWVSSYRELDELAWWSRHDPAPFLALLRWGAATAGRLARRRLTTKSPAPAQDVVGHFDGATEYWDDVYRRADVEGQTYRTRLELTLQWLKELGVGAGDRVLDLGTGAGHLAAALAHQGVHVVAVDSSPAMLHRLHSRAGAEAAPGTVRAVQAQATALPFPDRAFRATVALGVLPWVDDPAALVQELARVCADDGHLLISSDSRKRLHWALDPRYSPTLIPLRRTARPVLERLGLPPKDTTPHPTLHEIGEVEQMLTDAGTTLVRRVPVGYGPFTFLGLPLLRREAGARLSALLERAAATRSPQLAPRSSQHLVLAKVGAQR